MPIYFYSDNSEILINHLSVSTTTLLSVLGPLDDRC